MVEAQPMSAITASPDALAFTNDAFIFDGTALYYVLDEPYAQRCVDAGVNAVNVTFFSEGVTWDEALERIETGLNKIARSRHLMLATCSADLDAARAGGKLAVVPASQGSSPLADQPRRIRILHRLGFRVVGLAYTGATMFADGCGERRDAGVSFLGRDLIEEANALNVIMDLSHCGHRTRAEATELATFPVCTHSNAYSVLPNDRNTKDETARAIAAKHGVMGVCGLPRSVWPTNTPTLAQLLDHLDHWVSTVGVEHVSVGFDFIEGYVDTVRAGGSYKPPKWRVLRPDIFGTTEDFFNDRYPAGLESIQLLPNFTQGMFDRGYTKDQAALVLGGNWRRLFAAAAG